MKIRHLSIHNFGHFADRDIALGDDGLQVIYGPNEAGKTTLLEFLRCWLFDFPLRTPYDFKSGVEIAGSGELTLDDGRLVELRRRKGIKNKIGVKIDGAATDLDEAGFQRLIGHANRHLFESVFAFGLDQLSQGEESLKHESMQSALFGGGLGGSLSPEKILDDLDRQAGDIFLQQARKPAINALLAEIKTLSAEIKAKSLRSEDYRHCREAAREADERAKKIHQEVDRLRRDHQRKERLSRAWQKWRELGQCAQRRAPLSVPRALPIDARQQYRNIVERLGEADEERLLHGANIEKAQRGLAALRLDPRAISLRAEIKACLQLKQSTVEARRDLPERIHRRDSTRDEVDRELRELRPGWDHGDLEKFLIDAATRDEIDRLAEEERSAAAAIIALGAKRDETAAQIRGCQADLDHLGEPPDAAVLIDALAGESAYRTDVKQHEDRSSALAALERQLAARLRKLTPPLAAGAREPHTLPVPRIETVARFEGEFNDLREQLRALIDAGREESDQERDLRRRLEEADSGGAVPSLDERDNLRRRRDAGWDLIRRRHVDLAPAVEEERDWLADSTGSLVDAYEQVVRRSDEIADRIYAQADAVARREEWRRQVAELAERLARRRERVGELRRQEAELEARWRAAWAPCGFEPLAPDAMRRWLADHESVCDAAAKRDELAAEIEGLRRRKAEFEHRLRAACGRPAGENVQSLSANAAPGDSTANAAHADSGPWPSDIFGLLAAARRRAEDAQEHRRRTTELRRELKRLGAQLAAREGELAEIEQSRADWLARWRSTLGRLKLPQEWNDKLAPKLIERLSATQVKLAGLPHEEVRIRAMQARIDEFESQVRPLCEALAPELLRDPPELAADKLSDQLARAEDAQRRHDQLQEQLAAAEEQRTRVLDRRQSLLAARGRLFAAAEASSEAAFLDVVSRAEIAAGLDADIERLNREIDLIRLGEDREEFEQALGDVDPAALDGRVRELAEQLADAEEQKRKADGDAAVAKSNLERLDGSAEAAALIDARSRKRAQLAAEVDRYAPLIFARRLLADSVRSFDRENQPEMIATVSQLIRQMTAGRYVEFDRMGGDRKTILVRRYDGAERTPSELSDGTRQQLYLAIRLGYVLHYCRQNEALPIVMDDVLVNFDDDRARHTLSALSDLAQTAQVLFFTCHPHLVSLAQEVVPQLRPIDLASSEASVPR